MLFPHDIGVVFQFLANFLRDNAFDDFLGLRHFDTEGNGMIKTSELRHLLTTLGDKLTEEEFKDLIAGHEDSNGYVSYEEFIRNLMSS